MKKFLYIRLPVLVLALFILCNALWAGLIRIGYQLPQLSEGVAGLHGPLMVSGFLGTLLSLERGVAIQKLYGFLSPVLAGIGGLGLIFLPSKQLGIILLLIASGIQFLIFIVEIVREWDLPIFIMGLGTFCWLAGNYYWFQGYPVNITLYWWFGFLLFTIIGERVEIGRLISIDSKSHYSLLLVAFTYILFSIYMLLDPKIGSRMVGLTLILFSIWLLRNDIAQKTIRVPGLPRYVAICLLSGYLWLMLAGVAMITWPGQSAGIYYDFIIHSLFIGFIFSVIFGHAPIIMPALTGFVATHTNIYYVFMVLLQVSLFTRLIGDLSINFVLRQTSGLVSAITIISYLPFVAMYSFSVTRKPNHS